MKFNRMLIWRSVSHVGSKINFDLDPQERNTGEADGTGIPIEGIKKRALELKVFVQRKFSGGVRVAVLSIFVERVMRTVNMRINVGKWTREGALNAVKIRLAYYYNDWIPDPRKIKHDTVAFKYNSKFRAPPREATHSLIEKLLTVIKKWEDKL